MHISQPTLPPAPRRVYLQGGWEVGGLRLGRLITCPPTIVGLVMVVFFLRIVLFASFSSTTSGTILEASQTGGRSIRYSVSFVYSVAGEQLRNKVSLDWEEFGKFADRMKGGEVSVESVKGREVEVRYLAIGPWSMARLAVGNPWREVFFLGLATALWNVVIGAFVIRLWIIPLRERWLVRHGSVVMGRVVAPYDEETGERTRYEFQVRETGEWVEGRTTKGYSLAEEKADDAVTVVYMPGNPRRNRVLELSEYAPDVSHERERK